MSLRGKTTDLFGLALWLALCLGVAGIGGAITRTSVSDWYQDLHKPSFNPPDWVFTPVWISLFLLMGISAWMVWRTTGFARGRIPLTIFGLQLALNLAWSYIFFGVQFDLTGFFWTKRFVRNCLGKEFCHAEEKV